MSLASRLSRWPRSRIERLIRLASFACALVVIVATVAHALQLRSAIQTAAESRLQTVARILTKEVNRSLLQTRGLLDQVDEALRDADVRGARALGPLLESLTRQQTLLREIAVVDPEGRIVASSDRRHVGLDVSALDFARAERDGQLHVGVPKAGRSFAAAAAGVDEPEGARHAFDGFLTVARAIRGDPGQALVVAVIGADSLVGDLRFVSSEDDLALTLYRYDGQLLAASDRDAIRRESPHPIFARFLPDRETGGFADTAIQDRAWRAHFDTTADFPVVVEVRLAQAAIDARWELELAPPALILLITLSAIALYTRMTESALRERRRSEEQAATQERRLRNILETAADGIVTIDRRGTIRQYNRAAETIFGVPAASAVGRPLSELMPPVLAAGHQSSIERYLQSGRSTVIGQGRTLRTMRPDGRPIELHLAVSEILDQGEHLFTGIVRDVTIVKQAEERFRTLFERSGEPHLLFDRSGLVDCNDAAAALLRAPARSALLGTSLASLSASQQDGRASGPALERALVAARRDGVHRTVWQARALDGTSFPVEMTLTPISLGAQEAMLVAWHDIAERQRYEQQLREARDAAESAAAAKAQFLAMMSHELRTPMSGIIGMIDLLDDPRMSDEQRHFVEVLRGSARSLLAVLNDVLDYSKIEAGHLELERIDFRPATVVREVLDLLSNAASQRGNTISARWEEGASIALSGDPQRLRQVLFNLVGNAIKFTERGTVTLHGCTRTLPDGRFELSIAVADTGVGIAPEVLPTLFRPFQQADSSTTRRFGGTGLGLAICRRLVEAMGGEIGVESRPGAGSTFRVVVRLEAARGEPDGREASPPTDAVPLPPPATRRLRLLVAEDNPTNRLLIGTRLRRAGHEVDLVEDGLQALQAVQAADYDVVLMDMQMPELDGTGATRAIRAMPPPRGRIPIVALSADALPEFRARYMAAGLDEYLTKPIDWALLDRVLGRLAPGLGTASPERDAPAGVADRTSAGHDGAPRPDADEVAAMQADLGEEVWSAVLEVYWPKAQTDLAACTAAVGAADETARRAAAHSLKGASASLGFASIAACAGALERCGPDEAEAALAALRATFGTVRAAWPSETMTAVSATAETAG